jgi:hypothetical protein
LPPKPAPSRPVADNELIDIYRETLEAARSNSSLRCRDCGQPMTPGGTRITDGVDVWHPACVSTGRSPSASA